jgi:hypothetical protein
MCHLLAGQCRLLDILLGSFQLETHQAPTFCVVEIAAVVVDRVFEALVLTLIWVDQPVPCTRYFHVVCCLLARFH